MTYCFRCKECGLTLEKQDRTAPHCLHNHGEMIRDYRAEGVAVDAAVSAINRDMKSSDTRDLFLPTRKDFERKHGHKGEGAVDAAVKTWNETHENPTPGSGKYRPK